VDGAHARMLGTMKQVVLRNGQLRVAETPAPSPESGRVLVANAASVISSGTERAALSGGGGGGSLLTRAIRNPDLVLKTLDHARRHGIKETRELVRGAVTDDITMGYSTAGVVLDTGGIADVSVGDRVACAGAGSANHAEVVSVPANLAASVPDGVPLRDAAFATLGAIALQGVRRAQPTLGDRVVVVGLGLLGMLSTQLLRAAGCQVVGVELLHARRGLAKELGAERALEPAAAGAAVHEWTGGYGADAVVVCASAASSAIVNQAIELTRRKGRVVPVGDIGLDLNRAPLYQREADVLISTSYGPGRYDRTYEEQGIDYPLPYVRWTENRNMEEFLRMLATGTVRVEPLVELDLPVERAEEAYQAVNGESPPLAAVLTYRAAEQISQPPREVVRASERAQPSTGPEIVVGVVGAGSFVRGVHLPNLKAAGGARVKTIVTRRSTTASNVARSLGDAQAATDPAVAIEDPEIDLVIVGTRHDSHAELAAAALNAGKAVFVEKPLGLTREEIDSVWAAGRDNGRLAIGFNRPFASLAKLLGREVATASGPTHLVYRISAPLPSEHWLNDPREGGGRLLGEACHMFDFANWLCGTPARVTAAALPPPSALPTVESASVTISYSNGSVATVHYSGVGARSMPKERVEVLRGGRSWVLEDFRSLTSYGPDGERTEAARSQDKGHAELVSLVLAACRGERAFEPGLEAAYAAQSVALGALESIVSGATVEVPVSDVGPQAGVSASR
jgi:predicted dehydrogenase/threonine dehydrogenase-like Zn-dependent dehydrogenase